VDENVEEEEGVAQFWFFFLDLGRKSRPPDRQPKRSTGIRPVRYVVVSREWIKDAPPPQTAFQI